MLPRIALLILIASAIAVDAGGPPSKLVGKWEKYGIDTYEILSFQADHAFISEVTGKGHVIHKGTWKLEGRRLIFSWPDAPDTVGTIVKLTSETLILRWPAVGDQIYDRTK